MDISKYTKEQRAFIAGIAAAACRGMDMLPRHQDQWIDLFLQIGTFEMTPADKEELDTAFESWSKFDKELMKNEDKDTVVSIGLVRGSEWSPGSNT